MDFRGKKQVIINGKSKSKLFYEDRLIWSKLYGEFSKDFKNLEEEEEFFGDYDSQKGCLLVSNKFIRLAPIIEFESSNHAKVEYGENFKMPRVRAYSISDGDLEPSLEIYRDGAKVDKVDTKVNGKYELRYSAEIEGKRSQISYFVEVYPKPEYRYIRDWLNGSNVDRQNRWVEIQVFDRYGYNVARGMPAESSGTNKNHANNNLSVITDGKTESNSFFGGPHEYVTVDLGAEYDIRQIKVWHFWIGSRRYNHKLQVSVDGKEWKTIFDSDKDGAYSESAEGKTYILG